MIRLNITFTDKDKRRLDRLRKQTGKPTSQLIRELIEKHFKELKGSSDARRI